MSKKKELQRVIAIQDQDCHWYVIPADLQKDFVEMEEAGEIDQWEKFNEVFGDYSTGGDLNLIELYAKI